MINQSRFFSLRLQTSIVTNYTKSSQNRVSNLCGDFFLSLRLFALLSQSDFRIQYLMNVYYKCISLFFMEKIVCEQPTVILLLKQTAIKKYINHLDVFFLK